MNRTLVIVDCHNLFTEGNRKYPNKLLNYEKVLKAYSDIGFDLMQKVAYGKQPEEIVVPFASLLKKLGFELMFRNINYTVPISLRVASAIAERSIDRLILGTSQQEMGHILEFARRKGVYTHVFGFNLPRPFSNFADCVELEEDYMQERRFNGNPQAAKQVDVPASEPSELTAKAA